MSGTGKSSVIQALSARGFKAVDTDDGWCEPFRAVGSAGGRTRSASCRTPRTPLCCSSPTARKGQRRGLGATGADRILEE